MPEPNNVHVNAVLSNISIKYSNAAYVGSKIMPVVQVKKKSDIYYKYDSKADRFRIPNTLRAPKTDSKTVDWKMTTDTYDCKEYALNDLIDDIEKDNADKPINMEVDTVEFLTDIIDLDQEKRYVDLLTGASMTHNTTITVKWEDYTNSAPIEDIEAGKQDIHSRIFRSPNKLLLGKQVYDVLVHHPDILDRIKYVQKGIVTADLMASVFGVDEVIVGEAGYNTKKEGQTAVYDYLWGKYALLAYVEPQPGLKKFSLGYTFQNGVNQTRSARMETKHSDWYEVSKKADEKLVCVDCSYLMKACIT
jgi:hypothetical protein